MFMFNFEFDGNSIDFHDGDTVASALIRAGVKELRRTRFSSQPRSIFCGIGQCFDCLVVIDDVPNQRACITLARSGMKVRHQEGTK